MRDKQEERVVGPRTKNRFGAIRFPKMCFCETQGSLFFLISVYPYLEKTPNFNRFYKKLGQFYKINSDVISLVIDQSQPGVLTFKK